MVASIHGRGGVYGLAIVMVYALLAGCASGPRIITNVDPSANLQSFQTFDFMQPLSTDRDGVRSLLSTHLIEATTRELENAGMRRDTESPQLLVNFFVSTRETIETRSVPTSSASMMSYRRGRYSPWGSYSFSTSTVEVVQRTEGTINVDLVDVSRNQLVWEGAAIGRVTDRTRRDLEQTVNSAIAEIFARFPR
jgi:hypothetical protein